MGYVHMLSLDLEHEEILPQVTEKPMFLGHTVTPPTWSEIQTKVHEQSPWLEAEEKKALALKRKMI